MRTALVGQPLVRSSVRFVHGISWTPHRFLTLAFVLVFGWAALSQALHLEPVIGAFAMGILLGRARRLPRSVAASLEQIQSSRDAGSPPAKRQPRTASTSGRSGPTGPAHP